MKSNTKEVRNEIRKYIIECMDLSGHDMPNTAKNIFEVYNQEFNSKYEQKRTPNNQDRFCDWLKGSPSVLNVELYYNEVRDILINRFKTNTPAKRDDNKSLNYFLALIYNELVRMAEEPQKESAKMLNKIEKTFK
jgi:hypothetical protein